MTDLWNRPALAPGSYPLGSEFEQILDQITYLTTEARGFAYRTSTESLASSTTLQNDDELFLPVRKVAEVYRLTMQLFVIGNETGDFKFAFTKPSGWTLHYGAIAGHPTDTGFSGGGTNGNVEFWSRPSQTATSTSSLSVTASTTDTHLIVEGIMVAGASAVDGNLQLQWAQNTSNGTAVQVKTGSWLELRRMA